MPEATGPADGRSRHTQHRPHYAWVVVVALGLAGAITSSMRMSYGVFLDPLLDEFGWSRGLISGAYALSYLVFGFSAVWTGALSDRYGTRLLSFMGGGMFILSLALLGTVTLPWQLYVYYGILMSLASSIYFGPAHATVTRWFSIRLGMAIGIVTAVQSLGPFVAAPLLRYVITVFGWKTAFYLSSLAGGGLLLLTVILVQNQPSDMGLTPYGQSTAADGSPLGTLPATRPPGDLAPKQGAPGSLPPEHRGPGSLPPEYAAPGDLQPGHRSPGDPLPGHRLQQDSNLPPGTPQRTRRQPGPQEVSSSGNVVRTAAFRAAARSYPFWMLITLHLLGCVGHSMPLVHVVSLATDRGIDGLMAATFLGLVSGVGIISRFGMSVLADAIGGEKALALTLAIQSAGVILLLGAREPWVFYLFSIVFGTGFGGEMVMFPLLSKKYFHSAAMASIYGYQVLGASVGMAAGGYLGGLLFDLSGDYILAIWISVLAGLLGVVGALSLIPLTGRRYLPESGEASA